MSQSNKKIEDLFDFDRDYLILDRIDFTPKHYITANNLIRERRLGVLTLDTLPNIFSSLIKANDFTKKVPLHNMPYATGSRLEKILHKMLKDLPELTENKHIFLRRYFKKYMKQNLVKQWKYYKKWFEKKRFPLPFLRVIAFLYSKKKKIDEEQVLVKVIKNIDKIVNAKGEGALYVPKNLGYILNERKAYFVGASFGDGCLLQDENQWTMTDGHQNIKVLPYSYTFLKNIKMLLKKEFGVIGVIRKGLGRKYVLIINNKFFCRLLNFFYGIPFGEKKNLEQPLIFNLSKNINKLEKKFFAGLIDTDGSIFENSANIRIELSHSNKLIDQLNQFLTSKNILSTTSVNLPSKSLFVPTKSFKKFLKLINLEHPYKKLLAYNNLKKGSTERFLIKIKKKPFYKFLLKNSNRLRIYGAGEIIKNLREKTKVTSVELSNILNVSRGTIKSWEENANSIGIKTLFDIAELSDFNILKIINFLQRRKILWSYGRTKVKLPCSLNKVKGLAQFIRPGHSYVYIINRGNEDREEVINELQNLFGIMPAYEISKNVYRFNSEILRDYFNFFFRYEKAW